MHPRAPAWLRRALLSASVLTLAACGSGGTPDTPVDDASTPLPDGGSVDAAKKDSQPPSDATTPGCGTCPQGYTCGKANGLDVCRASSGIPLFSHVVVILMENTTLATLATAEGSGGAPNLAAMKAKYATGSNYHGVVHPSLPNYVALTSGDTQGITCDCKPDPNQGTCNVATCNLLLGSCSCNKPALSIADQLETAKKSWFEFGEDMGTACNTTSAGGYAARHVPFLYYDGIRSDATRCQAHVVDFTKFDPNAAPAFAFIAPNLTHDMHDPFPASATNIKNGDDWIGPEVDTIVKSSAYTQGGLLVVVWDEDDASGGVSGTDDPVPIFVMSPYAKSGGFVSATKADHYALLATFEDGLGVPRLGKAAQATPLADYFPAN